MNKERVSRREMFTEAGAWLWTAASTVGMAEGTIRYQAYKKRIDENYPSLEDSAKRKLINGMAKQEGDDWKDNLTGCLALGYILAILIAGFKAPPIIMSR